MKISVVIALIVILILAAWGAYAAFGPKIYNPIGPIPPYQPATTTGTISTTTPGSTEPLATGVRGSVMLGPTCPVERIPPDPACADKPYQTTITARDASGAVAHTQSNASGAFTLPLPPGFYTLTAAGGKLLPRCADASVFVPKSGYATTTISCDTGIR